MEPPVVDDVGHESSVAREDRPEYPARLQALERELIGQRRAQAEVPVGASSAGLPADAVGLALSGGGIRSATFCLGFCQALARRALLRRIDVLSSVSGGGYLAGFLGALIARRPADDESGIGRAERELADDRSPVVDWLRENGRYLAPNGSGDELLAGAVLLRNAVAVQTVLATAAVAVLSFAVGIGITAQLAWQRWAGPLEPDTWSLYFAIPVAAFALVAVPNAWAYWMVPYVDPKTRAVRGWWPIVSSAVIGVALACAALGLWATHRSAPLDSKPLVLAASAALIPALLIRSFAVLWSQWRAAASLDDRVSRQAGIRNRLSRALAGALWFSVPFLVLAVVDSLGAWLYRVWEHSTGPGDLLANITASAGWVAAVWVLRRLAKVAPRANGRAHLAVPVDLLAGAAAIVLIGGALVVASGVIHAIAWRALLVPGEMSARATCGSLLVLFMLSAAASYSFGQAIRFANDSSDQALYGARLARAYLGASNPNRLNGTTLDGRRVTDPISGDDLAMGEYAPERHGGPLHLINVTLNETVSGESQIEHRDRKGLNFAVGPAGVSAGVRHHARWDDGSGAAPHATRGSITPIPHPPGTDRYHALADGAAEASHPVEELSLRTWIAISGAAVAPGLGSRTSLGLSALLTIFNVRLGYWWDSGIDPSTRPDRVPPRLGQRCGEWLAARFPVQTHLTHELLSRFHGPNRRRWYLSDGGHFENTAGYELIRRRLPFIIVCDCGQDADFTFADIANLVRKARTDFHAEIRFLSPAELRQRLDPALQPYIGTPAAFSRWKAKTREVAGAADRPYALLAEITYANPAARSLILFVKPALRGDEPEDVINYARTHADFPHESTGDQYFDEAQWESYRRLGEVIGARVLDPAGSVSGWTPRYALASGPAPDETAAPQPKVA
jgi:hypothetical protein